MSAKRVRKAVPRQLQREEIEAQLEAASRLPFVGLLARLLGCAPTDAAIDAIAQKNPDRWAQMLAIVARLAGYTEKLDVNAQLDVSLHDLSDAELMARAQALQGENAAGEPPQPESA